MFALKVVSGPSRSNSPIAVRASSILIGRSAVCDVVIDDLTVSPQHVRVEIRSDGLHVVDLSSENGVWSDGLRYVDLLLRHRTRFRIGEFELEVLLDQELEPTRQLASVPVAAAPAKARERLRENTATRTLPLVAIVWAGVLAMRRWGLDESATQRDYWILVGISFLILAAVATGLSLIAKLVTRRFRYIELLQALLLVSLVDSLLRPLARFVIGNGVDFVWVARLGEIITTAYWAWIFSLLAAAAFPLVVQARRLRWSALMAVVLMAFIQVGEIYFYREHMSQPLAYPVRLPGGETEKSFEQLEKAVQATAEAAAQDAAKESANKKAADSSLALPEA